MDDGPGYPHGLESSTWKEHVVVFACQRFTWNMETWVDTSFSTDGQKSTKNCQNVAWENNIFNTHRKNKMQWLKMVVKHFLFSMLESNTQFLTHRKTDPVAGMYPRHPLGIFFSMLFQGDSAWYLFCLSMLESPVFHT